MGEINVNKDFLAAVSKLKASEQKKIFKIVGEQEWGKCADDLLYWLDHRRHYFPYVFTQDEKPLYTCNLCAKDELFKDDTHYFHRLAHHLEARHGQKFEEVNKIRAHYTELPTTRPFPIEKPYIIPIANTWQREQVVLLPKSRDMIATWQIVAYYTWDSLFHSGRQNFFQSETGKKALALVRRAWFIYSNQPKFLRNVKKAIFRMGGDNSGQILIPEINSEIAGLPQGADQIRMYHPSGVFMDEAAFQIQAGEAFAAIKPAIQNGGRLTAISSANPGWFQLVCEDRET